MTLIPGALLRNLYNRSSLRNSTVGVRFSVKNRLSPASLKRVERVSLNGEAIHPEKIRVAVDAGDAFPLSHIGPNELIAGTVLAGEISLAAAISSLDWVSSHEQLGRNDPTRG